MIKNKPKKSRQEIDEQSKLLKRKKKRKGLPSGARANPSSNSTNNVKKEPTDPRVGSKKPIPLIVESVNTSQPKKDTIVKTKQKALSPEQELKQLENDPYLDELLDLDEAGAKLTTKQQQDLDNMLDRIDALMKQLGYIDEDEIDEDDDDEEDEPKEDIVALLKRQ